MIYKNYFNHTKNLKQVVLISTGRTGSDFFNTLLEGHPQILQLSGGG